LELILDVYASTPRCYSRISISNLNNSPEISKIQFFCYNYSLLNTEQGSMLMQLAFFMNVGYMKHEKGVAHV